MWLDDRVSRLDCREQPPFPQRITGALCAIWRPGGPRCALIFAMTAISPSCSLHPHPSDECALHVAEGPSIAIRAKKKQGAPVTINLESLLQVPAAERNIAALSGKAQEVPN